MDFTSGAIASVCFLHTSAARRTKIRGYRGCRFFFFWRRMVGQKEERKRKEKEHEEIGRARDVPLKYLPFGAFLLFPFVLAWALHLPYLV